MKKNRAVSFVFLSLLLVSCTKPTSMGGGRGRSVGNIPPTAPSEHCPIVVDPGKALGPIRLDDTRDSLAERGLFSSIPRTHNVEFLTKQPLQVKLCKGKVVDIKVMNFNYAPDCLYYQGKSLPVQTSWKQLGKLIKGCKKGKGSPGAEVLECEKGIVLEKNSHSQILMHVTNAWNKRC